MFDRGLRRVPKKMVERWLKSRLSGKPAFHQNEKVVLEHLPERQLFTTADHAQRNMGLTAPVQ